MKEEKNIFIMGDSYSTYEGYIPKGYFFYYSDIREDAPVVKGVEKTWWKILSQENNFNIVLNDSFSGSTISNTVREGYSIKSSFINDLAKTTFGIYLIHENVYIRQYMYKVLLIDRQMMETNYFIFFKLIFYSIIIFFTAALIDKIRMRFIEDRIWYKKIIGFFERNIYKIIE